MDSVDLNILAIVLAAVAYMVIGAIWYSPLLFANRWMEVSGRRPGEGTGNTAMAGSGVLAVIVAVVLAVVVDWAGSTNVLEGLVVGVIAWLGFAATTGATNVLFAEQRPALFAVNQGNLLVSMAVMGAILGAWQ